MMKIRIPNNPPLLGWLIVCGFIGSGLVAYSQVFPNPALIQLNEEFKVHEATPAHGTKEIRKELQQIHVTQQIILKDLEILLNRKL